MTTVVVRYPGRACLLGEHCDWAGGASLAVPVPLGIEVRSEPASDGIEITTALDGELLEGRWPTTGSLDDQGGPLRFVPAAAYHLSSLGIDVAPQTLWVTADLPAGRGFSSSAAFTLGVLDSLARGSGHVFAPGELAIHATTVERDLLRVQCGRLDPVACAAGEPVYIQWHRQPSGDIEMSSIRIRPRQQVHLVVGVFERPRNTAQILATLNRLHRSPVGDTNGDGVRRAIHAFGNAAELGARALQDGDLSLLGEAMGSAQQAYENELAGPLPSLAAPNLRRVCTHLCQNLGALGAKFSGAGGDGSVVALFASHEDAAAAIHDLGDFNVRAWYVPVEAA